MFLVQNPDIRNSDTYTSDEYGQKYIKKIEKTAANLLARGFLKVTY